METRISRRLLPVLLLLLPRTPCAAGSFTASSRSEPGDTEGPGTGRVPDWTAQEPVSKRKVPSSVTMDTEAWESLSQTASTYTFSTTGRAGERTLLSVITNSTSPYTEGSDSSEASSQTSSHTYQTSTRTNSQTSAQGSQASSQSFSHLSSRTSQRTQQFPYQSSSDTSSQSFAQVSSQASSQNSSQTFSEEFQTSSKASSHWKSTASQDWTNETSITLNETGYTDYSQLSLETISGGTPNSTLALSDDSTEKVNVVQFSYPSESGTSHTESKFAVPSEPPDLSTEDSIINTSRLGTERSVTLAGEMAATTESFITLLFTQGNEEPETIQKTRGQLVSTEMPLVGKDRNTTMDHSLEKITPSWQTFTTDTEQPEKSSEAPSSTDSMVTHRSELSDGSTYRVSPAGPVSVPPTHVPSAPSTAARAQSPTTPASTQVTELAGTRSSTAAELPPSKTGGTSSQTSKGTATTSGLDSSASSSGRISQPGLTTTVAFRHTESISPTSAHTTRGMEGRPTTEAQITTAKTLKRLTEATDTGSSCDRHPCLNGGTCVLGPAGSPHCGCLPGWMGPDCNQDMDECVSGPCPVDSVCVNTRGSFSCECHLGYDLENGRTCTQAKTFLGTFKFSQVNFNNTHPSSSGLHELQREILQLLNSSLATLKGYRRSTLRKNGMQLTHVSAVNMFSMDAKVTHVDVLAAIRAYLGNCSRATPSCGVLLSGSVSYSDESLCQAQAVPCDVERTLCVDGGGTAICQCRAGYFKYSSNDLSCRECGDGFKLENGTCVPCMFGFGGFNCENFYKLIAMVVSPAACGVLLILAIALIVTRCRKDRNDIDKIIFKSGDLQLCPYPEYPKGNRASAEWGREAIEMQENGSTKNLLQMTDVYYSAPLRPPEWPSRQSCIYPAQWNPSFISDDTRRRDYF